MNTDSNLRKKHKEYLLFILLGDITISIAYVPTLRYRGPQILYDIASCRASTDCNHRNTEAYPNVYVAVVVDKQCRSATIVRLFDHVNGWPVRDNTSTT